LDNSANRCFGIAGDLSNFGNPAKAGSASPETVASSQGWFGINIYGNSSGPSRERGLRGRPPASLAADMHGDTGTAAAAKP